MSAGAPGRTLQRLDREGKRLLVADDSATYREVAARVLGDAGYQVWTAADGAEALERLGDEERPLDLVVLELNLAKVRGLDLIRRMRETPRLARVEVLVVTEPLSEHLRRVLADFGLTAMLTKNHALRELLYQVDAILFPTEADRRASPRRLGTLPVNYWVGSRLCLQSCFDLSEDGMFVASADEEPPAVGTELELRFWLPTADRLVACEAEVVWVNGAAGDLRVSHPPGMGLRFTRIDAADLALVRDYLRRAS